MELKLKPLFLSEELNAAVEKAPTSLKFSIVTPEHTYLNIHNLAQLWDSIINQTYTNWEWVVYCNGEVSPEVLKTQLSISDDRVKWHTEIREHRPDNFVGDIKNAAFSLATGDIIVEVDHDDKLRYDCLEKLNEVYENDPDAGFVYSDCMYFVEEDYGPWHGFSKEHGWTDYSYVWPHSGEVGTVNNTWKPTAKAFSYVWYAPDHVRSWKRSLNTTLNSYNPEFNTGDDIDWIQRLYIHHTKFVHIPEPLYFYRLTGAANTSIQRNDSIQVKTKELWRDRCSEIAVIEGAVLGDRIELGGGETPTFGLRNYDLYWGDVRDDLNNGIPVADNSVGIIRAWNILHLLNDPVFIMRECWRVLVHGGWLVLQVPSTEGKAAFSNPIHRSFWNYDSFYHYTDITKAKESYTEDIRFQSYGVWNVPDENGNLAVRACMIALKDPNGERFPGPIRI